MNLEIGTQVGDYRILSRIGKGAYGIVFEAEHVITRRIDALKLLLDSGPCAADEEQRFLREIQVQASLQHPNVAAVYNAFRTDWGLALVMELVRGESLGAILGRGRPPLGEGVGYILATLDALSCAEGLGIVHRDIKPDNILITPEGTVKLTDFGLAQVLDAPRITGSGENIGTPCYMSPEQVSGTAPADARSDIYSTGVVLYEVVTGRPPFQGTNGFAVMLAHQNTAPAPPIELEPAIDPRLNQVILKALEKDPAARFQSAAEFHTALKDAVSQPAAVVEATQTPRKVRRPKRWRAAIAFGFAVGVCGLAAWSGHFPLLHRNTPPPVTRHSSPPAQAAEQVPQDTPAVPVVELPAMELPAVPAGRDFRTPHAPRVRSARSVPPSGAKSAASAGVPRTALTGNPASNGPEPEGRRNPACVTDDSVSDGPERPPEPPVANTAEVAGPAPQNEAPKPPAVKRRNVIIRTLGRIFGKHGSSAGSSGPDAAPAASPVKPDPK